MAQDFFAAFGHDAAGTIGTDTTISYTDVQGIPIQESSKGASALDGRAETLKETNGAFKMVVPPLG